MRVGSSLFGVDLTAHHNLLRAFESLNTSSLRLATMQRINRASDDPAGLIAAEQLRSEIAAIEAAGQNAARASGAVRVADSALGEISGLLNSIRGNVLAAAGGGLSDAEIAAKQIEVDAALEAINRIGNVTSFGGRKLLDGSAGFQLSGVNAQQVADIQVHAAAGNQQILEIEVTQAATAASLTYTNQDGGLAGNVTLQLGGEEGTVTLEFSEDATLEQIASAVNASTAATGVAAAVEGDELTFSSTAVGSDASLSVQAIEGTFDVGEGTASGTDVVVSVDGVQMVGNGNQLAISTQTLQADIELAEGFSGQADPITISGSALTFVFSPDVSNTSTLALPNVSTSALGGSAGRLSDLAGGGSASLASGNLAEAMAVLDAAGSRVLDARSRAGAFEKYTIESSRRVLDSMHENVSEAASAIIDTDVAMEASRQIQSQILLQASLSSLMLAGNRRNQVGSLLGMM